MRSGEKNAPESPNRHQALLPAQDLDLSKAFYTDLGFTIDWSNDEIAQLQISSFRFLLEKFFVAPHAGNFMMSLSVDDAGRLVGVHPAKGVPPKVLRHHVQAACDAALGPADTLLKRPHRRSLPHRREP